jgi:carbamoyltransferase
LVKDGRPFFAIEEERISRIKYHSLDQLSTKQYLYSGIDYCLSAAGIKYEDIGHVYGNDLLYPPFLRKYKNVKLINHHLSHAASGFYQSPFHDAAILVVDGNGSFIGDKVAETVSFYKGVGNSIELLTKFDGTLHMKKAERNFSWSNFDFMEHSIGSFYGLVSETIGFKRYEEGKMMGLAPYGIEQYTNSIMNFCEIRKDGYFHFSKKDSENLKTFILNELKKGLTENQIFQIKANIAFAAQKVLEDFLLYLCDLVYESTKIDNICLAGGVFMNCVANYRILKETPFKNIFIHGAAGDNGTSLGAALWGYYNDLGNTRKIEKSTPSLYLGKSYSLSDIQDTLKKYESKITYEYITDVTTKVAEYLTQKKVIGWFQAGAEFGARALGNRSIIADPRDSDMKDIINSRIKRRESFRPFAPSVLAEKQTEYFDVDIPSPYMTIIAKVKENKIANIPAVTHIDKTARLQTVDKQTNPKFHELICRFENLTGVPVVLNTSLNEQEPIVETPEQALECFLRTDIDMLVIDDYIIFKKETGE